MSGCINARKRWGKYKELKKKKAAVWMEMIPDYCSVSTHHKNLSFLQKQPEDKVRRKMLVGTVAAKRGCATESTLTGNKVNRSSYFWDVKAKHFWSSLLLKSMRFWHPVSRGSKTSAGVEKKPPQLRTISLKMWITIIHRKLLDVWGKWQLLWMLAEWLMGMSRGVPVLLGWFQNLIPDSCQNSFQGQAQTHSPHLTHLDAAPNLKWILNESQICSARLNRGELEVYQQKF